MTDNGDMEFPVSGESVLQLLSDLKQKQQQQKTNKQTKTQPPPQMLFPEKCSKYNFLHTSSGNFKDSKGQGLHLNTFLSEGCIL